MVASSVTGAAVAVPTTTTPSSSNKHVENIMKYVLIAVVAVKLLLSLLRSQLDLPVRRQLQGFPIDLEPFQLVYYTSTDYVLSRHDDNNTTVISATKASMDASMLLLDTTREHLDALFRAEDHQDDYNKLMLYMSLRSDPETVLQNGTMAAFTGKIYFDKPQLLDGPDHDEDTTTGETPPSLYLAPRASDVDERILSKPEYLSFLNANKTRYLDKLRAMGWTTISDISLMTMGGYLVPDTNLPDGNYSLPTESTTGQPADNSEQVASEAMMGGVSTAMILMAVLIPVVVLILLLLVWCILWVRAHVSLEHALPKDWRLRNAFCCSKKAAAGDGGQPHAVWRSDGTPEAAELRRKALEQELYRDIENQPTASQNSDATLVDSDLSARPALADDDKNNHHESL